MRIGIQAWGSEGDIRPLIAIGHGLVQRGHLVELVYTDIANRSYDTVAVMKEAVRMAGCRAIVQAEVPPERGDRVMVVSRTPHAQLFPRCAAVVHHCGAGTTHTTFSARMKDDDGPARAAVLIEAAMQRLAAPKLGGRTRAKAGAWA